MRSWSNQKRQILSVLMFISILYSGSLLFARKGPKIVFKEESWDFGSVKQGKVLTHVFVFKNEGDKTLKIDRVRTTCGCTAALVSEREIAPGKKGEIKVVFNTKGYGGSSSKYIFVESNDPAHPRKRLTVSAKIDVPPQPRIDLDRYSQDLGVLLEKEEIHARTRIKNRGETELTVTCSHRDASFFSKGKKISFPLKIRSGKDAEIEIKIPPGKRKGMLHEYVTIKSNDPMRFTIHLNLRGYIINKKQLKSLFNKYKDILS